MTTSNEQDKDSKSSRQRISSEDSKLIERAKRRGSVTDILGTMVFENTEKVDIDDILDEDLILLEYKPAAGKFGEFVVIHLMEPSTAKHISCVTGGAVVVRKVKELTERKALPCMVTITRVKDYYDLT